MKTPTLSSARLAAGRLPFWKQSAPALAVDVVDPETGEAPVPKSSAAISTVARVLATALVGLLMFVLASWVILGVTVMPTPRVDGTAWAVKWAAWPQEAVPAGALIAATTDSLDRSLPARFGYQFSSSDVSIHRVLAGPGGTVSANADGAVTYDGQPVEVTARTPIPSQSIGDAYLTVCIAGCGDGTGYASRVETSRVMGEALGVYSPPFSVRSPDLPAAEVP